MVEAKKTTTTKSKTSTKKVEDPKVEESVVVEESKPKKTTKKAVSKGETGTVNVAEVTIRSTPTFSKSNIIGKIQNGEKVSIDKDFTNANFYKVKTSDGLEVYIIKQFIDV